MSDKKPTGFLDYSFCPLTQKACAENQCGWWVYIDGKGGCALRCLGALVAGEILCHECKETIKLLMNTLYVQKAKHT